LPDEIEFIGIIDSKNSPLREEGRTQHQEKGTKPPLKEWTGRLLTPIGLRVSDHPVCSFGADTPPHEEGNIANIAILLSSASFESDMIEACRVRGLRNIIPLYSDWHLSQEVPA
jgi:hypothetical protein